MLQLYDATRDPLALSYSKAVIDCAWNRWNDTKLGGGLWYNDAHSEKSSYQSIYALDLLTYSQYSGDADYRDKAKAIDAWAAKALERNDGLYWEGILPSGIPNGHERPYAIKTAGSVVFLAGNMAWAILDARLYAITHDPRYLARSVSVATAIKKWETVPSTNIVMNDRDAFVDGTVAYPYAMEVTPLLPPSGTADASTILATARSIAANARGSDGTYGGDWQGPLQGKWYAAKSTQYRLNVSAQGANLIIAGYAIGHKAATEPGP